MGQLLYSDLTYKIIGLAMEVYNELGYGFLEKVYENALMLLLEENDLKAEQQHSIEVEFKGKTVGNYIADIIVEDKVILELKSVKQISNAHKSQILNYLKATNVRVGIILNFAEEKLEYERFIL
ncbi:GxxExxY protein [Natroniella sulfidigena]|uniref:GxxExxY protein n=1 Tax=Natroniella sulfidigena TaxID=723921 RepID=UPI00200ACA67|nr:GxxExxY protein [Natroniella sulfidigena]MCK8816291.1 GxxExxY protein [Natroniella sulfidigena]